MTGNHLHVPPMRNLSRIHFTRLLISEAIQFKAPPLEEDGEEGKKI